MNGSNTLAAGVAAAMVPVCAMPSDTSAAILYSQSDFVAPANSTRFVALVHQELHRPPTALLAWGTPNLPAGPHDLEVPVDSPPGFDTYALIGVNPAGGVLVSFANPSAALGLPFSTVFPGFDQPQVAEAIITGGPLLTDFLTLLDTMPDVGAPMGAQSRMMNFSSSADYGSFIADFSPVPAPGAALLLTFVGSGTFFRRRRPERSVPTRGSSSLAEG